MRQIILDTETTGLSLQDDHRIIEIGCLEMVNRRLTGSKLHFYINPERAIAQSALNVHGITDQFLAQKPLFKSIIDELITYLRDAELIIHNAPFDVGFLNYEFERVGKRYKKVEEYCRVLDTLILARSKHPGQRNSLDALCKRYHVDNSNRDFHGALLDAELLAQVYLLMTGGQTNLFEAEAEESINTDIVQTEIRRFNNTGGSPLPIVSADREDIKAHQDFLLKIKEKGQCLWLEQSNRNQ